MNMRTCMHVYYHFPACVVYIVSCSCTRLLPCILYTYMLLYTSTRSSQYFAVRDKVACTCIKRSLAHDQQHIAPYELLRNYTHVIIVELRKLNLYGKDACPDLTPRGGIGVRMVSLGMVGIARGIS